MPSFAVSKFWDPQVNLLVLDNSSIKLIMICLQLADIKYIALFKKNACSYILSRLPFDNLCLLNTDVGSATQEYLLAIIKHIRYKHMHENTDAILNIELAI